MPKRGTISGRESEVAPAVLAGDFVGRQNELTKLRGGLSAAIAGHGQLFYLVGEPGIGKTRLAEEIASEAAEAGAKIAWGRCWEGGGAPAYWP